MHRNTLKRAAVIALIIGLIAGVGGPAYATGSTTPKGDLAQSLTGDSKAGQRAGVDTTLTCTANAAPVPQYSNFNGFKTVQWGAVAICNIAGTLFIHTWLATVAGVGDKEHFITQDTKDIGPRVDTNIGNSWGEPCLGGGSARWVAFRTPTYDGLPFNPPTQSTAFITLPCVPIPG